MEVGKMVRVLLAAFVFICMSMTVLGGFNTAQAQDEVESLADLVGARAGQAERALNQRGYTWVKTEKSDDSAYSYWTEDKTGKCVTIRTADGVYKSIVYAPDFDCKNKAKSTETAQDPNTVPALADLVGARGGQAERALNQRGYTWVKTEKSDDSAYSYWTEDSTGKCVTIRTSDGSYQSIIYAPEFDCKAEVTKAAETVPDTTVIDANCKLYNKKSDNNKYKGSCTIEHKMSDDLNVYVIKFNNGDTYKFTEQSSGYQVDTPEGMSKNMATMTDHGDKSVFKWGKWKLTAQEN
jgi:hypothetical protein